MRIVSEAPLPGIAPYTELVQKPHSKSLSECRNTGLVKEGLVPIRNLSKFMQGFDCEQSVIVGCVVCCSAGNDLVYHLQC